MGYGCMDRLSGKWGFLGPLYGWELKEMHLTSNDRSEVTGTATVTIEGVTLNFRIAGMYNGASLDIRAEPVFDENEPGSDQYRFSFVGNCKGNNVFQGPISGLEARAAEVQLKHLG